jgi:putative endonuclease
MTIPPPQDISGTPWFIYIVECSDSSYYTGVTTNIKRRLHEHNNTAKGAKYTRCRRPVALVYQEETDSRQNACKREYAIKKLQLAQKKTLVNSSSKEDLLKI